LQVRVLPGPSRPSAAFTRGPLAEPWCGRLPLLCRHALFRLWFLRGIPAFAAVLAILWLMLAKLAI
jgi:hypothetical protein